MPLTSVSSANIRIGPRNGPWRLYLSINRLHFRKVATGKRATDPALSDDRSQTGKVNRKTAPRALFGAADSRPP